MANLILVSPVIVLKPLASGCTIGIHTVHCVPLLPALRSPTPALRCPTPAPRCPIRLPYAALRLPYACPTPALRLPYAWPTPGLRLDLLVCEPWSASVSAIKRFIVLQFFQF